MMRLIPFGACALLLLGAPSMAFESLTCVATGTGSNVRYMIDGKHIHIREKGKHEKHPLSNHRRVANQDLWDSMLDGVQPGTLTVANDHRECDSTDRRRYDALFGEASHRFRSHSRDQCSAAIQCASAAP